MPDMVRLEVNTVPFSATVAFVKVYLNEADRASLHMALRPILHHPPVQTASLSDRQEVHNQLRFFTRARCLRGFRAIGRHLAGRHPEGLSFELGGTLNKADQEFFEALGLTVALRINYRPERTDAGEPDHPDLARIRSGLKSTDDWNWLRSQLELLLNCGDSWTASWLADAVVGGHKDIPPRVGDVLGLAYGLQDRAAEAEQMFRRWRDGGAIDTARADYSLAMMYARHHRYTFRSDERAVELLSEAWDILGELEDREQVVYERIFNRNGLALIYYRRGQHQKAISLLERCIKQVRETGHHRGVHHSVLSNNLGRVYAAAGDSISAEKNLQAAIDIDPKFAEYWLDLASFLADEHRFEDATHAAEEAEKCSADIVEVHALLGYLHGRLGRHEAALDAYRNAWHVEPGHAAAALGAAHHASELGRYDEVREWLAKPLEAELSLEQREARDILLLDADANGATPPSMAELHERLVALAERYPRSEVVRQNLEMMNEG